MSETDCFSLFHFCRVFAAVARRSPYDYSMRRKLSEAARALAETETSATEIAFDFAFNNLETFFSRAFRRFAGVSPSAWRKSRTLDERRLFPAFDEPYLRHLRDRVSPTPTRLRRA